MKKDTEEHQAAASPATADDHNGSPSSPVAIHKDKEEVEPVSVEEQANETNAISADVYPNSKSREELDTLERRIAAKTDGADPNVRRTMALKSLEDRIATKSTRGNDPPHRKLESLEDRATAKLDTLERRIAAKTAASDPNVSRTTALQSLEDRIATKTAGGVVLPHGKLESLEDRVAAKSTSLPSGAAELERLEHRCNEKSNVQAQRLSQLDGQIALQKMEGKVVGSSIFHQHNTACSRHQAGADIETAGTGVSTDSSNSAPEVTEDLQGRNPSSLADNLLSEREIIASVVDDELIRRQAQQDLLSTAEVVTAVKIDPRRSRRRFMSLVLAACFAFLAIFSIVCGTGNCKPKHSPIDSMLANDVAAYINSLTLRASGPIAYPYEPQGNETTTPPEEQALQQIIQQGSDDFRSEDGTLHVLQRYALAVLWFANGPFTVPSSETAWLLNTNECEWGGIECSTEGRIIGLSLGYSGARGQIPDDIGLLTDLKRIKYNGNKVFGSIPVTLQNLHQLESLSMFDNALNGTIPSFFGDLKMLQKIDFWNNMLTGSVPIQIFKATQLSTLSLGENLLRGPIPSELGMMTRLTELGLFSNDFTGTLPQAIFKLTDLERFSIVDTNFAEPFPDLSMFKNHTKLRILSLGSRVRSLDLPVDEGCPWPNIEKFKVAMPSTARLGRIPPALADCTNLRDVVFGPYSVGGTLPSSLFDKWGSMEKLHLSTNFLNGTMPASIGKMTSLKTLLISDNMLSGSLPASIGKLTDLNILHASNNFFTGTLPIEVYNWKGRNVNLQGNNFTGSMPFCENATNIFDKALVDCNSVDCDCCRVCRNTGIVA